MIRGETILIWVTGSKVKINFGIVYICIRPCGQDFHYSFVQSLSNFTCKLWMMRGGILLISGHRIKYQGQLWLSVYEALWAIQTTVNFQSLSNFTCRLWMMRGETLLILGHGIKGQGQLWLYMYGPCGHKTVYIQSLSNFTCWLLMMRGETLSNLNHGVICQLELCPPPLRGDATLCVV